LQGQVASESDGHRHISGTGGQLQFVRGAYASKGGKSFICLSSTYEKRGERRSRIVFSLTPGNIVTTPRSDVMYLVTEFGMVNLKGRSVAERAKAIIALAHPDFREDLERQARGCALPSSLWHAMAQRDCNSKEKRHLALDEMPLRGQQHTWNARVDCRQVPQSPREWKKYYSSRWPLCMTNWPPGTSV
jgi:acyl-CoA hydrolase